MAEQIFFFIVYIFGAVIAYIYFYENYKLKLTQTGSFLIATGLYMNRPKLCRQYKRTT